MVTSATKSQIRTLIGLASLVFVLTVTLSIPISQASNSSQPYIPQHRPVLVSQPATGGPAGTYFDHLVFIIMENEGIADICGGSPPPCSGGSNTPYMAALANQYGIDKQYLRVGAGTSQPQYIAIMAASQMNCTNSCGTSGNLHAVNLVDRLESAGLSWKAYMEDQGVASGCVSSDNGFYAAIHNPFVSFNDIFTNSARCNNIVLANPSGCGSTTDCALINDLNSGSAPNFMWLTPNNCDNMHAQSGCPNGCTSPFTSGCLKAGDNYLKSVANNILNSTTFKTTNSALFITFDEGNGFCPGGFPSGEDCMYNVWSGPAAKTAYSNSTLFNHYSFTKTIETNWGLSTMTSNDASATPMTSFLKPQTGPDFSISASPTSINALAGAQATSTVTLNSLNSFTGTVSLAVSSSPTGPTLNLNPTSVTLASGGTGTSTLTVTSSTSGNYTVTVTGTSGSLQHSTTVSVHVQDYSITASPTNIKTNAGTSGTSTITITSINHFAGTVSLSVAGTSGLTTGISPTTISGGSGTATLTASSTTVGNYTATVTSTSGSLTHTVSVTVQVVDFTINASQPSPVNAGASAASTITISAVNHFTGTISLTDTVPSGLSCGSISPSSVTGSGTATVSCSATVAGNYTLTITGTSGLLIHTATVLFQFRDFTISASSLVVNAGASSTSTITVTGLNKFTGTVALTDMIPSGLLCGSITPGSLSGSGTATVSCSAALSGNYTLTITGTSGSLVHIATSLFQVQNFGIAATSPSPVSAGSSATSTITINAVNHFAALVSLTDAVPSGLTCGVITPNSVSGSGTATVSCSATIAGNYTLTITGTNGSLIHTASALFQFRDFTVAASSPAPINTGSSASSTITVAAANHFAGVVSLTDTVPAGLACGIITPTSITGSGTANISCSASVAGNYTLTITGTSGSLVHNATAIFRFQNFTITVSTPAPINVGSSTNSTITILPVNGFAGAVSLSETVPSGLTCGTINPTSLTGSGTAIVSCNASAAGNYTLTIVAASGSLNHSATAPYRVEDFSISGTSPVQVNAGVSATSTITVTAVNGFAGVVSFNDNVPTSLTCNTINPSSVTSSGDAIVSCTSNVAGNYTLTVTGTSGAFSHSATVLVSVQDYAVSASPTSVMINARSSGSSTITITALNHFSGPVSFSASGTAGLTSSVSPTSLSGGSGTATLTFSSSTAGNYTETLTSSSGTLTHTITVSVQVVDFAVAASPATIAILAGATGNSTITVTAMNGFSATVNLVLTPSMGLTAATAPTSITGSGLSAMSASASTSGDYLVTMRASSGSLSHTIVLVIHVMDYSLAGNPVNPVAPIGSNTSSTLNVQSLNNYAGNLTVTFTVQADPGTSSGSSGAGGGRPGLRMAPPGPVLPIISINPQSFQLSSGGTQQSTVSISLPSNLPSGNYMITLTANDGVLSHQITLTLVATDFSLTDTPNSTTIQAGSSTTITLSLQSVNFFQGNVTLTVSSSGGGITGALSTSTVQLTFYSNLNINLTIQVPSNTAAGNYTITVQALSGTVSHSLSTLVTVTSGGFGTILSEMLSPHNFTSIGAAALITLLAIFATLKIQTYHEHKPTPEQRRRIENRLSRRNATGRLLPYSSNLPLLWKSTSGGSSIMRQDSEVSGSCRLRVAE